MKKITFIMLCLYTLLGAAQEGEQIFGVILDESGAVEGVHIYNKTQNTGVVTSIKGRFTMRMFAKDTLIFSSIQHTHKTYIVQPHDLVVKAINVRLEIAMNELEPVMLSTHTLTGNLTKDLQNITTYEDVLPLWSAADLKRMGVSGFNDKQSNIKNTALNGLSGRGSINLLGLFNVFKKSLKDERTYVAVQSITAMYSIKFITDQIDIPQSEVYNFIDFLAEQKETDSIVALDDKLKVLSYIMHQAEVYKARYDIIKN
ncbi:hypothetical protein ACE939_11805 [Aquimarina sp. W85]|uniref:hypothetical protein n=1 Tax=Aquimarina rhodophyticola TaxID=3342246 RepID=UPI00366C93C9